MDPSSVRTFGGNTFHTRVLGKPRNTRVMSQYHIYRVAGYIHKARLCYKATEDRQRTHYSSAKQHRTDSHTSLFTVASQCILSTWHSCKPVIEFMQNATVSLHSMLSFMLKILRRDSTRKFLVKVVMARAYDFSYQCYSSTSANVLLGILESPCYLLPCHLLPFLGDGMILAQSHSTEKDINFVTQGIPLGKKPEFS